MCYADKANTIVINSDGRIFKCTAINFEAEKSESNITSTTIEDDLKQNFKSDNRNGSLIRIVFHVLYFLYAWEDVQGVC